MPKYNIDDILSELGLDDENPGAAKPETGEPPPAPTPAAAAAPLATRPASAPAAAPGSTDPTDSVAQALVGSGSITAQQLSNAQAVLKQTPGKRITDILIEQGADEEQVQRVVAEQAGVPFERIDAGKGAEAFDGTLFQRLGPEFCRDHGVLPLRMDGSRAVVGATRPDDVFLLDDVRRRLNVPGVKLVLVTNHDVKASLEGAGGPKEQEVDLTEILQDVGEADVEVERGKQEEVNLEAAAGAAGESPVIRYVNYIIHNAVKEGASDIHVEPADKKIKVRFRIDGELFEMMNPPAAMAAAITSRLKIMANLDISERRLPQDGRIRCTVQSRKLDLRVSTLPTPHGEKIVMRILDTKSINVELDQLGFDEAVLAIWKKQVDAPHGIALVTGPTGSGKTTTLYASLRQIDKSSMNVSTVEDPVEYHMDGITQTQTHEKIGMTFAVALRALLRQDPDVIMLGEIRDMETAHIAVQAALTGHLVLSTLHTNDAPSSITRLVNIGLEPFLVGAAVNAVLAQRLVRRLCLNCKAQERPGEEMAEFLRMQGIDADTHWVSKGCEKCRQTGFSGRVGIYELLTVDDQLRDTIARNPNVAEFRRTCIERGMIPLRGDGMKKVAKGLTTVPEILRVTEANI